jgi:hypothetical protein
MSGTVLLSKPFYKPIEGGSRIKEDYPCSSKSALSNGVIQKKTQSDLPEIFASKNE